MLNTARLSKEFQPCGRYELIRLGKDNDGGYLVDIRDVSNSQVLVSFGINEDWSFEADFYKRNPVQIEAFDGNSGIALILKTFFKSVPNVLNPARSLQLLAACITYSIFFSGKRSLHLKHVGFDREPEFVSIDTVFREYVPRDADGIFLKIDIERWEYRILEQLLPFMDRITGMVIEFHDVDLHYEKIVQFLKKSPLNVAHIHGNNFAPLNNSGIPLSIEVTLTSSEVRSESISTLPLSLDQPNNPRKDDIEIRFS